MRIFISANNTECGKTYTTLKLIKKFSDLGYKVGVIKPIETGVKEVPLDGEKLFKEAKKYNSLLNSLTIDDIVPFQFPLPAAPFVVGEINLEKIENSIKKIEKLCDILLIEGAGGIRVPIKLSSYSSTKPKKWIEMWELAKILNTKIFLVIASKLGMINDFLLNKYFLDSKNLNYEWAINLFDDSYFKITHPFMKNFNPLIIQKDLDKIAKKLIGE